MCQKVICNIGFFFIFLCIGCTLESTKAMQCGHWVENVDDTFRKSLDRYVSSNELNIDVGKDKNALVVEDNASKNMVVIVSGMFPFSSMPDSRINELIDYVLPTKSTLAKNLNIILSNLSQIQIPGSDSETIKLLAQSTLQIIDRIPNVWEDVVWDEKANSGNLHQTLNSMVTDGKRKGIATYLKKIKARMLTYYIEYIDCLKNYFSQLINFRLIESMNIDIAQTAILKLDEARILLISKDASRFSEAVSSFQSVTRFQSNAHKLVHSEDILLYCIATKYIQLQSQGIRFFTRYDMCEMCEDIVCKYAHREENPTVFIVLSKEKFLNSQERDNSTETVLLKKRI